MRNDTSLVDCVKVYNMINSLEVIVQTLKNELADAEETALSTEIFTPLEQALEDFQPCKQMLDETIDFAGSSQNQYNINASMTPKLQELKQKIIDIKTEMRKLTRKVEDDLGLAKGLALVESPSHTYIFETDKKEGDAGIRASKLTYKILTMKANKMSLTC